MSSQTYERALKTFGARSLIDLVALTRNNAAAANVATIALLSGRIERGGAYLRKIYSFDLFAAIRTVTREISSFWTTRRRPRSGPRFLWRPHGIYFFHQSVALG
jgi:hypothetical protein